MTEASSKSTFRIPLVGKDDLVGAWVVANSTGSWVPGQGAAIGLLDENGLRGGVIFEGFTGTNINLHVASRKGLGRRWMTRKFLWMVLHYPFVQLGCKRVTAGVPSHNKDCLRFIQSIGFVHEATLEDAVPGGDLLVYVLKPTSPFVQSLMKYGEEHCYNGQTKRASAA